MKIGIDAKRAFHNYSGLGNYSRSLIMALLRYFPEEYYYLFTPKVSEVFAYFVEVIKEHERAYTICNNTIYPDAIWRSYLSSNAIKEHDIKIYHGLSAELPVAIDSSNKVSSVVTIHDLIYLRMPHLYKKIDRNIYHLKTKKATHDADHIIAISHQTRDDVINMLGVNPDKVSVVYQDAHPSFSTQYTQEEKSSIKQKYKLPDDFILSVGTLEERKNGLNLLMAIKDMDDIPVVFVGGKTDYYKTMMQYIVENDMQSRIFFLERIPQHELPIIYQLSRIMVYISSFEGFGIPIVEALHSHIPLITTNNSSMREIAGAGNVFVNPQDIEDVSDAIGRLWYSDDALSAMKAYNITQSLNFSTERFARDTMSIYKSLSIP